MAEPRSEVCNERRVVLTVASCRQSDVRAERAHAASPARRRDLHWCLMAVMSLMFFLVASPGYSDSSGQWAQACAQSRAAPTEIIGKMTALGFRPLSEEDIDRFARVYAEGEFLRMVPFTMFLDRPRGTNTKLVHRVEDIERDTQRMVDALNTEYFGASGLENRPYPFRRVFVRDDMFLLVDALSVLTACTAFVLEAPQEWAIADLDEEEDARDWSEGLVERHKGRRVNPTVTFDVTSLDRPAASDVFGFDPMVSQVIYVERRIAK